MATVPEERIAASKAGVDISRSPRAVHWIDAAKVHNWVAGRGWPIVPEHSPGVLLTTTSSRFSYRVLPRFQDVRYLAKITLAGDTVSSVDVTFPAGGTARRATVFTPSNVTPIEIEDDVGSQSSSLTELAIDLDMVAEDARVMSIGIEAIPRFIIDPTNNDLGCDRFGFYPRNPVFEGNLADQLIETNDALLAAARRAHFQHSFGSASPWTMSSGTFTSIFPGEFALLGRLLYNGDTSRTLNWQVKAYCSDGTTAGTVRMSNDSNGSGVSSITIPAGTTSATWLPNSPAEFDCNAEDNGTSNGLRGGSHDDHDIDVQRTAGSGTISIESISIWEP